MIIALVIWNTLYNFTDWHAVTLTVKRYLFYTIFQIEDRIMKFMPYLLREKFILTAVEIGMDSEEVRY